MQILIIIILLIFLFYIFDTYIKKIVYFILFSMICYGIYKFINWLIYKIKYYKLEQEIEKVNSNLNDIEQQIDKLHGNSTIKDQSISYDDFDTMEEHYFENYCTDLPSKNDFQNVIPDKTASSDINCNNIINNKQPLEEKNKNTINKKHNSKKTTWSNEDFNTFLWQCNSISELRDSKDIGYEYTELDNPNETLENGYRDALLDISDYTKLPLIDTSQDKYALHGYVERKMLGWEHDFEKCRNIFKDSTLPIIKDLSEITRNINTSILQNPDGTIGRVVNEIFFYKIPQEYQHIFCQLVNTLNESLAAHGLLEYQIKCADIKFSRTDNVYCKYSLPLSLIIYNCDKHTFHYKFSNEVSIVDEYSTKYDNTEYGEIIYTEDGNLKNANFNKIINGSLAKCRFKNYKSGFDLYDIRYNKSIIYKRNQNK